ncbi:MAG: hypothetical protein JF616_02075 [Fibrobacteres bacterium]|nr:hypothetical protein [Fibrobacterota bacterium]
MRSRIVRPGEMRETYGTQVRDFPYAFVLPTHGEGWDSNVRAPAETPAPLTAAAPTPQRRAGDKQPIYIEIKPKALN